MKVKNVVICRLLALIVVVLFVLPMYAQSDLTRIKKVCIDAGHGGKDPGAIGKISNEKSINLAVALKLGRLMEEKYPNIEVIYIRDRDVFVELRERTRIANTSKADLFISIHVNSLDVKAKPENKSIRGVETFIMGMDKSGHNLKVAMKENAVIHYEDDYTVKYEGFDPNDPISYIMFNMLQNAHQDNSLNIASAVQESLIENCNRKDRGVRQAPFWVLKDVAMPSILIELGFITNESDEIYMNSKIGQVKLAESILKGFEVYKDKMESNFVQAESSREITESNLFYAIQIASSTTKLNDIRDLYSDEPVKAIYVKDRYKYYVHGDVSLKKVKEYLAKARAKVGDCFIIAINNGEQISISEAQKIENKK